MKKSQIIILHILLWIIVFYIFFNMEMHPTGWAYNPYLDFYLYVRAFLTIIMLAVPFYYGFLFTPYLFKPQKRRLFIIITIAVATLDPIAVGFLSGAYRPGSIMQLVFLFALLNLFLILGAGFRSIFGWLEQKRLHDQLEKQNLISELSLLKTQLNPHFLFNTLHNIDTLIYDDQEKASKSLVKLSDIMRYMLKEANSDLVSFQNEIEHIENYLTLEKLRLKNERFLNYSVKGAYDAIKIAPMIIIPFVENAFKHAVDSNIENGIVIKISVENRILNFYCENYFDKYETDKDKVSGIGLKTVKKRLDLIYKNRYKLDINYDNSVFKVNLEIDLNEN